MFLNIGGSAQFKYKLPNADAPIEWIHNGKRIFPEKDPQKYQVVSDGLNRTLIIKDLRPEEQGTLGVKIAEKVTTAKLQVQALKDVSEHIGGSATFKYKMPHADAPIEWIHNGKRICPEKDPQKYQVVSDGLTKTLIIKDLKEEEQGTIGVKIGEKTSTAKLQVQALKDVSERIGGSATFKYKLPHEGAPIEWTHNGKRIYPEKEPHKYEIVSDGLNRTLVIKNLKIEEQGSIGVKIADKVSSAKLQVQGAGEDLIAPATAQPTQTAAQTPPVIVKGLDEFMTGLEENEVTLEATVDKDHRKKSGEPIEGEWSATKKGAAPRVLRPSYKYHMSQNDNVYALTIKDLMFEDEGVYTFKFEGAETQCKLKVDEAPVVFTKPLSRINAKEKDDVTLECEANKVKWKLSGKDIDFSWKKGDARMDETGKVKFEKQGRKLMLVMKKISLNDASEYSCNAGEGPTASKTIGGIEVQELPLGFDEGLKDLEKTEGETAVLEAVINRPGADVLWFKDGKKIDFSDPRFEQKQDKDGRIQLIIKPCVMDDEATYEAKVGTKKTSCKFRVKEGPVVFTRPLADMSVKEGAPAILHAEVNKMRYQQSGAAVNITWYRNDIPISKYDDRVELKNDECHLYCTIKKIAMDDTGSNYSVTADTAKTAGTLSVTEEPLYFVEKLKDTPLKKIPSTITLSCKLNKPGVPVQWLKDGMPIKIDGDKYDVKEEDGKHILIILDCNGDDEGKYTCKVKDVTCDCQLQVKAAPTLDITDEVR